MIWGRFLGFIISIEKDLKLLSDRSLGAYPLLHWSEIYRYIKRTLWIFRECLTHKIHSVLIKINSLFLLRFFPTTTTTQIGQFSYCMHVYVYRSARETISSRIQFTPRFSIARHIVVDGKRARNSSNSNNILPRLFVFVLKSATTTTTTTTLIRMIANKKN